MRGPGDAGPGEPRPARRAVRLEGARGRYIEALKASLPRGMTLDGLKIVVDCANGAAYGVAPRCCGSSAPRSSSSAPSPTASTSTPAAARPHPEAMCAAVLEHGADLGIALDGDADRIVLADERGELIDGDQMLALLAQSWQASATC